MTSADAVPTFCLYERNDLEVIRSFAGAQSLIKVKSKTSVDMCRDLATCLGQDTCVNILLRVHVEYTYPCVVFRIYA